MTTRKNRFKKKSGSTKAGGAPGGGGGLKKKGVNQTVPTAEPNDGNLVPRKNKSKKKNRKVLFLPKRAGTIMVGKLGGRT